MVRAIDILLVEDSQDDIELTLRAFRKNNLGNNIHIARDGEEALEFLRRVEEGSAPLPGLILLDIKLPGVDGIEVLRYIKSRRTLRRIPVVMLTTSKNDRDIETCYDLGANSYIVKPVSFRDFMETVKNIQLYWIVTNQPPVVG
ncbi:MAG: response regulator [Euryarchaeota archaeon]|nr:response regulator [Euryarchaeota archaeon]